MPVDTVHPAYADREDQWERIRDVLAGSDAVKAGGTRYLPQPGGMDDTDYGAYKTRALFYNATARTASGLVGALTRKSPAVTDWPEGLQDDLENITLTGIGFDAFVKSVVEEMFALGRVGVITDLPVNGGRPYLRRYLAEDITNWSVDRSSGVPVLSRVVLREMRREPDPTDDFDTVKVESRLVLQLDEGRYIQQRWEKQRTSAGTEEFIPLEPVVPRNRGQALDFIPFQFFGVSSLDTAIERSPLLDLVDVNVSHYITSAELEHAAHFTSMPTPWVAGGFSDKEGKELRIGSGTAWLLDQGAQVGMLSTGGQGLAELENRLAHKERQMAVLGARLLEDQKAGVESEGTVRLRHSGENSILASIANIASRGLENNLRWYLDWVGQADNISVEVNRDFMDRAMTAQELTAFVAAWQGGAIGGDALYHNFKAGEILPEGMTRDEFDEDRAERGPGGAFMDAMSESEPAGE